jgi:hypothetical protein
MCACAVQLSNSWAAAIAAYWMNESKRNLIIGNGCGVRCVQLLFVVK